MVGLPANPYPADQQQFIEPVDAAFSFEAASGTGSPVDHYIYRLDKDQAIVESTTAVPEFTGSVAADPMPSFSNVTLEMDATYYWRIDTLLQDSTEIQGALWNFKTEPIDIPGKVINYSSDPPNQYLMSPSIIILPDGTYIANHEYSGPWSNGHPKETLIWESKDQGRTWRHIATVYNQYWSSTFYLDGTLYLMGIDAIGPGQSVTIRRSDDNGYTWTEALDDTTGLLRDGTGLQYHTGPVPVAIHNGRIFRAMEDRADPGEWAYHFRAMVLSAPVDSDLLDASNWISTPPMSHDEINWTGTGWLEGNAIVSPSGEVLNILRVAGAIPSLGTVDTAAIMHISDDGTTSTFDPNNDFIDMPGGGVKFVIRYDEVTGLYWTLSNQQSHPYAMRNRLVLCSSPDLLNWTNHGAVLEHWDIIFHAWQYVDWRIEGEDMIFVSRTSYPMGGGVMPHGYHDANFFTFHRITNFRDVLITPDDDDDDDIIDDDDDVADDDDDDDDDVADDDDDGDDDDSIADDDGNDDSGPSYNPAGDDDDDNSGCCG